jgi:hypothetical protein
MIRDGAGVNRTDCRLEAMATGIGSSNFTRTAFPVALLAVMVSVSSAPSLPPNVHRRTISSPSRYRAGAKE